MLFENITMIDEDLKVRPCMYVGVKDDKIDYISDEAPAEDYGRRYDGKGTRTHR